MQLGEVGVVLDDGGNQGLATVRAIEPQTDGCGVPVQWRISIELQAPDADEPSEGLFVVDYELEARAHTLRSGGPAADGESILHAIDRDGDGDGDLRVSQYGCDVRGVLDRTTHPSHRCTDTWLAVRGRWVRARADRVAVCDR
jgi:hypothetical protein